MDRNTKIGFAVAGGIWLWGMWKQFHIYERLVAMEKFLDQMMVDEQFGEIAEEIGDIGQFPDES